MLAFWKNLPMPVRLVLVAQVLGLGYAVKRKAKVTSMVTGLTIAGIVLGEWQTQKNAAAKRMPSTLGAVETVIPA